MKKAFLALWVAAVVGAPFCGRAATDGFDRYRVILERKPFGEPPPPPEEPAEVPELEPPWAKMYRLCSVYEADDGEIQVAVLDTKTNKPIMLTLGEEPVQGIELISANIGEEEATLKKDGLEVTMKLEAVGRPAVRNPELRRGQRGTPAVNESPSANPDATAEKTAPRRPVLPVRR